MANLSDITEQAKQFWASRNMRQRGFLLGGAAATVAVIAVFVRLLGSPDYKPLYRDMEPSDAQALASQLDAQNIPHQTSADGKTISVPADKLDAARLQTASQGKPHSGRMGFEIFDKVSWGQTEFDEKVNYQRALEGELERTIGTLTDVESARVHLVMPQNSVFVDRDRDAKASVILRLRHGSLSKDAVLAISHLVSGAVENLKPEDVAIIDADSDRSLGLKTNNVDTGANEEARLAQQLVSTLEPVVGVGKVRASVNIDYDQASMEENQEKYDPAVSVVLSDQKSEEQSGGTIGTPAAPGGTPGTASNVPAQKAAAPPKESNLQLSKTESAQYGVNKTTTHTITPAGRVQRVTAALLVDDAVIKNVNGKKVSYTHQKRSQDEMQKIRDLAAAAIGIDAKRGDTLSVQNMSFDGAAADDDLPAGGWTSQIQKTVTDYSSLLRPLSLLALFLLAYLFVLRPVQKQAFSPAVVAGGAQPVLAGGKTPTLGTGAEVPMDGAVRAAQLKAQTLDMIRQKPTGTARAVQTWMREESL